MEALFLCSPISLFYPIYVSQDSVTSASFLHTFSTTLEQTKVSATTYRGWRVYVVTKTPEGIREDEDWKYGKMESLKKYKVSLKLR